MKTDHIITVNQLIQETVQKLQELNYSPRSLKKYLYSYSVFQSYAESLEIEHYSQKLALTFLEEYCEIFSNPDPSRQMYEERRRALSRLDEMHQYGIISSKKLFSRKSYLFKGCLKESIGSYMDLKRQRLSSARMQSISLYLERFSAYVSDNNHIRTLHDLQKHHIVEFFTQCSHYTDNTIYATAICLRHYLLYLEANRLVLEPLASSVPKIARRRNRTFPSAFSEEETRLLLESIGKNTSKEKRDYAMILLAARLGLRSSDITGLRFDNLDWGKNEIHLIQQKTGTPLTLPLLNDVGEAIIDYIKRGRPNVNNPHIFIREVKPYSQINSASLYTIVEGYLKRASIKLPAKHKHGPHAMRHSLASRLLENNIPITTIKEILAHKSVETTKMYLKIDHSQLMQCALEVNIKSAEHANL